MEKTMPPMEKAAGSWRLTLSLSGANEFGADRLVIHLPDSRFLRLVARSVLLAFAIFSFSWLSTVLLLGGDVPVSQRAVDWDASYSDRLLSDLSRRGLLLPGDNTVILTDRVAGARSGATVLDGSADVVFSAAAADFEHVDRILKDGGIAAVRLGHDPSEPFRPPVNYRMAYAGRIGSATVVAMRKTSLSDGGLNLRRLLTVPTTKKEALSGLEGALLEPPGPGRRGRKRRAKFLPELTGDALDGYPRRVFVEVAAAGEAGSGAEWFKQNYPTKGRAFEVIRVEVKDDEEDEANGEGEGEGEGGTPSTLAEWLERNVKEEEYVVVKAEAASVEEAVAEGAIGLVDELFLECDHQMWEDDDAKRASKRRPYWECLALYGKLRDAGVAVHQWWSF